jgi:hypothetical protein
MFVQIMQPRNSMFCAQDANNLKLPPLIRPSRPVTSLVIRNEEELVIRNEEDSVRTLSHQQSGRRVRCGAHCVRRTCGAASLDQDQ